MLIMAPILPFIAQSLTMLSPLVTALGEAFSVAASGVGTAISMIISAVVPLAAVISEAFTQIASVVAGAVVQIVQAIAPILPEITKRLYADYFYYLECNCCHRAGNCSVHSLPAGNG